MYLVSELKKNKGFFIILSSNIERSVTDICYQIKLARCKNSKDSQSCNSCKYCKEFEENRYHYIFRISKEPSQQRISIEKIREFENYFYMKVENEFKKYFIVENAQTLSVEAQNHLLKTLEEIPDNTFFFFICKSINNILSTILSRGKKIFMQDKDLLEDLESYDYIKAISQKLIDFWISGKKKNINLYENIKDSILSDKNFSYEEKKNIIKSLLVILFNKIFDECKKNVYYLYFLDEILKMVIQLKYNITLELFVMNLYIKLLKWKSLKDE